LLFGLLSGCFTSLVSIAVWGVLAVSGLFPLPPIRHIVRLLRAILGVSPVLVIVVIIFYESFLEL
jgi:hypothetical protein